MGLYNLQDPYSLATWIDVNGAYDLNLGADLLLDLPRHIINSKNYMYRGVAFPKGADINLAPGQTFSGTVNLVPNSYLVSLTGWSGNANQFTLRIFDKGAQADLFYGQFAWYPTVISNMQGINNGVQNFIGTQNIPFGPFFFRAPLIVLPPGVLQIQVTNVGPPLLSNFNTVQMLFGMAVPRNPVGQDNRNLTTSSDQTGVQSLQPFESVAQTVLNLQ